MVLCKYFQNGNCRFGSKCVNDHIDIKQIIKAEIEAAIKGSQWPLSCFGPFKEKSCIPGFIEDQSYEEIRYLCYEAKRQNCFPAFQQQFTQQVMEAQNKMKTLLSLNREVVDVVVKIYDSADTVQKPTQQANPFALGGNVVGQSNSANIFGNTTNRSTGFPPTNTFSGGNIFASVQAKPGGGNILGQSAFGNNFSSAQSSIFANQQSNTFSLNQIGQQTPSTQGGNIFSITNQQQQNAAIFGVGPNNQQQNAPFGTPNAFASNSNQQNIFNQGMQQQPQQQPMLGGGVFPQSNQNVGTFAQQQTQLQNAANFGPGLFGQTQQQHQLLPPNNQNVFGTPQQQQSAFMQQPQQQNNLPNQFSMQQENMFAAAHPNIGTASIFNGGNQMQQVNAFNQPQQVFSQQQIAVKIISEKIYSKIEDLSAEDLEAFKAEEFVIGKIPTCPPPRDLI